MFDCPHVTDEEHHPILREEQKQQSKHWSWESQMERITYQQKLVQAGEAMIDMSLTSVCSKIWKTREMPITWNQFLVERQFAALPELQTLPAILNRR